MSIIFDPVTLDQARRDADAHSIDLSRCRITPLADGGYSVTFDAPMVNIGAYLPDHPSQLTAHTAASAEGLMLSWATKIQAAERRAVRTGIVGWDSVQISRTPIAPAELDAYRTRQREAALQRKIAAELVAEVEQRQQEANKVAAADLAARYPDSLAAPRKVKPAPAVPELPTVHVKPSARGAK